MLDNLSSNFLLGIIFISYSIILYLYFIYFSFSPYSFTFFLARMHTESDTAREGDATFRLIIPDSHTFF